MLAVIKREESAIDPMVIKRDESAKTETTINSAFPTASRQALAPGGGRPRTESSQSGLQAGQSSTLQSGGLSRSGGSSKQTSQSEADHGAADTINFKCLAADGGLQVI